MDTISEKMNALSKRFIGVAGVYAFSYRDNEIIVLASKKRERGFSDVCDQMRMQAHPYSLVVEQS